MRLAAPALLVEASDIINKARTLRIKILLFNKKIELNDLVGI
jgi:hypothetical protein